MRIVWQQNTWMIIKIVTKFFKGENYVLMKKTLMTFFCFKCLKTLVFHILYFDFVIIDKKHKNIWFFSLKFFMTCILKKLILLMKMYPWCCFVSCLVSILVNDLFFFLLKEEKYLLKLKHFLIITMGAKCMNCYTPPKGQKEYKWFEQDLMSYIDNVKYEHFVKNMNDHFARAKVVNLI